MRFVRLAGCIGLGFVLATHTSPALGQGTPALCGDVSLDQSVSAVDRALLRGYLAQLPGAALSFEAQERCNTIGQPGPCDMVDVAVLSRALEGLQPGVQPACPAVSEPDPSSVTIEHLNGLGGRPTDTSGVVGAVDASFDVNSSGAAVYTIPFKIPPGTQGVEPKLALAYNSQGSYGIAGVGFELTGFSQIARCARTEVQDGDAGEVGYDANDRFCLDGMRLVKIGGGGAGYATPGSRYYTEGQTWTRVEAGPSCNGTITGADGSSQPAGGPCTFSATLKNGTVVEYGDERTASCSMLSGTGEVRKDWPATKVRDTRGNTVIFTYSAGGVNQCKPLRVEYTGNDVVGAPLLREVRFLYQLRPASVSRFSGGIEERPDQRLHMVRTYIRGPSAPGGEKLVREYRLSYLSSPDTQRSRLAQILECDVDGVCLPPTVFDWQDGNWLGQVDFYDPTPSGLETPDTDGVASFGDLDGDARPDFAQVYHPTGTPPGFLAWQLFLSKGASYFWDIQDWIQYSSPVSFVPQQNLYSVNVTGGPTNQILVLYRPAGCPACQVVWSLYEWVAGVGMPLAPIASGALANANLPLARTADFTGDGRTDVLIGGVLHAWENGSFVDKGPWIADGGNGIELLLADFNGDGKVDVLKHFPVFIEPIIPTHSMTAWELHFSNGTALSLAASGTWPLENPHVMSGDWNGDGLTDVLLQRKHPLTGDIPGYVMLRSTGTSLLPNFTATIQVTVDLVTGPPFVMTWGITGPEFAITDEIHAADWNGDGMTDILRTPMTLDPDNVGELIPTEIQVWLSQGDRIVQAPDAKTIGVQGKSYLAADLFGVGLTSVLMHAPGPSFFGPIFVHARAHEHPDFLVGITNGENAGIAVVYEPMSKAFFYSAGSGAVYPNRNWIDTRYLTYSTTLDDGGGLTSLDTLYEYENAVTNLEGLGFLGFERVRSSTLEKILETRYAQLPPFSGAMESQKEWYKHSSGDHLASWITYSHEDVSTTPGVYEIVPRFERKRTGFTIGGPYSILDANFEAQREWQYGLYGTVVRLVDEGDTSDSAYTVVTETTYSNDATAWRLGYPTQVSTLDASAVLLARKSIVYDASMNASFQGDWDAGHAVFVGTTVEHDAWGNPLKSTDPLGADTFFEYDVYGFLTLVRNPLGHEIGRLSDARFGVEIERADANGNDVEIKIDGFGRTTEIDGRDPNGSMTALRLFALTSIGYGHVKQTWSRRNWGPSEFDWKEEFHDGLGRVYRTRKRGEGNDAIRTDLEFALDRDRLQRESKAYFESGQPVWSLYAYDFRGRVREIALPGGQVIAIDVDETDRSVVRREPDFTVTTLLLDARGKLASRTDPEGGVHYFEHDALGRLLRVSDAAGVVTETAYDTLGRRAWVSDRDAGLTTFEFDASGHLVAEQDAKAQRIERSYDALDRTLQKRFFAAGAGTPGRVVDFEYDDPALTNAVGQLTRVEDYKSGFLESRYTFGYDRYGRQAAVAQFTDGKSFTWSKEYDAAGQAQRFVYPDGSILRTTYTAAGSLSRLQVQEATDPPNTWTTHARYTQYDAEGRPGLLLQANGTATCWIYDDLRGTLQGTATSHFSGSYSDPCQSGAPSGTETPLIAYDYAYDGVNRVEAIDDLLDPARSQDFGYNDRGELTSAQGIYGAHSYGYAANGNMISRDGQTLIYQGTQLTQAAGQTLGYDANGNLTSTSGFFGATYSWDVEDRLVQVTRGGQTTAYRYNFDGKRIRKQDPGGRLTWYAGDLYEVTVQPGVGAIELHTKYVPGPTGALAQISRTGVQLVSLPSLYHAGVARLYDTTHPLGWLENRRQLLLSRTRAPEFHRQLVLGTWGAALALLALLCLAETRSLLARGVRLARSGVALATTLAFFVTFGMGPGAARAALVPGANGRGVPLAGTYYLHPNHLGSTTVLTDAAGTEVSRVEYDPWGNIHQPGSSGADIFRPKFTGQEFDTAPLGAGAELYYMDTRYYDPALQRFISADASLGGDPLRGVSLHRYAYAANSPITYVDPGGQAIFAVFLLFGAALAVAGALIAGTEGKILTDPGNAFDDFSWTRALFGAWIGFVVGAVTFGLSFAFTGVSVAGISVAQVVSQAFVHAVIDTSFAYARGEADVGSFFAYLGIGLVSGFLAGAGPAVGAALGEVAGKLVSETASALLSSALKRAVDGKHAFNLRVWAFSLQFRKDGSVEFGADYLYLASQAISTATNFLATQRGQSAGGDPWDFAGTTGRAASPDGGALGWLSREVSVQDMSGQVADNLYDVLKTVARGVTVYAVHEVVGATGAGQHVLDAANFAVDRGFDDAFQSVVEPEGFADLAKGKLD